MRKAGITTLELTEYMRASFSAEVLDGGLGETLWRRFGDRVAVGFPSPKSGGCWELTSLGWVGLIPLAPELRLLLRPKVRLANLFRMLEYAYRLRGFHMLDGLFECEEIEEFYSELASILAQRVLHRGRRGLYHAYVAGSDRLPYLRGGIDLRSMMRQPYRADFHCHYHDSTADTDDNRLLAWTLALVARSGACDERVLPDVRRACRMLQGSISLVPFSPADCAGRRYNHLNEDYRGLHALCRFFLEHTGPALEMGERSMIPFLVDMGRLFELFVAEWLRAHLPPHLGMQAQETVTFGATGAVSFRIDLVLSHAESGAPICVVDTKYKIPAMPGARDVAQVVAYAEAKGCSEAILLYPADLPSPVDIMVGRIRVRSLAFRLDGDLQATGHALLHELARDVAGARPAPANG